MITHIGVGFYQQISSLVSSVMQRLSSTKKGKGYSMNLLNVSANRLSLCSEQRVDFVQEMGD